MGCSRTGTSMWARWGTSRTATLLPPSLTSSQPDRTVEHVEVVADDDHLHRLLAERDHLAGTHPVAGDVDPLAVDVDQAVVDELAGLRTGSGPAGAVNDVVEAQLEQAEQVLTGDAGEAGGLLVNGSGTATRGRRRCTWPSASPGLDQVLAALVRRRVRPWAPGRYGRRSSALRPLSFSKMLVPRRRIEPTFGPV